MKLLTVLTAVLVTLASVVALIGVARIAFPLPANDGAPGHALPPAQAGRLADALHGPVTDHPGLSGIAALQRGADAFAARMILADTAVSSIDVQYYIWQDDLTGALLLDALKRAADRGVRVRLLLDDNGIPGLDPALAALEAHPMVQVRLYNPFTLRRVKWLAYGFDFFRLNRRMHNKSFTVDNHVTILGGRNVGDEYFGTGPTALFVDLDVLAVGHVVTRVSDDFDLYWNSPSVHPAASILAPAGPGDPIAARLDARRGDPQMAQYREILETSDLVADLIHGTLPLEWTTALLVSDDPAKGQGTVARRDLLAARLYRAIGKATTRFDGVSPYLVPGAAGVRMFAEMERAGIEVRMLTNSMEATDVLPVHAGYAKRRKAMLKAGVELYELRRTAAPDTRNDLLGPFGSSGASLHAKTFAVDGQRMFVGSFNFDPRSTSLNTEMGLLIDSARLAEALHAAFDDLHGMAWQVRQQNGDLVWIDGTRPDDAPLTAEPGGSLARNLAVTVIGWLPVEWLL